MKKTDLEDRIRELEQELNRLKGTSHQPISCENIIESQVRFFAIADFIPAFIGYVNAETLHYEFVNELYVKSFNIPKEKIIGKHIKEVIGETNYKFALKYINQVRGGKSVGYENSFQMASEKRWLHVNYSPVYANNKKVIGIALVSYDITERKHSEDELKKSEERLEKILDASPFPIALVDFEDNHIQYWSQSAINLFGHTASTADEWYKLAYPDEGYRNEVVERWKPFLDEARSTSRPINTGEYQVTCKNGSVLTCEIYATFIENNLIVTFNNISKRKSAEKEFRSLAESMPQIVWTTRADGWNTYFNQQWVDYTGLTLEESYGHGWNIPFHPDDQKRAWDAWQNAVNHNAEYSLECRLRKYDGTYHWWLIRGVPQLNVAGEITKWFGTCTDIERIKIAEITLKAKCDEIESVNGELQESNIELLKTKEKTEENELKFRKLFENSPIGKSMTGIDGTLHVNKAFCDIVGYSEEELKDKNWTQITHTEDIEQTTCVIQSLLSGALGKANFEKRYIHKDGRIIWADVSTYLQRDKKDVPQFFITTIIDITERKKYELELIRAKEQAEESDRLKSAFLANMSHEIRTPMNGILGFAELLKEPRLSSDEQQQYIDTIEKSGARLLSTINSIINISKIEAGNMGLTMTEMNLNDKIEFTYNFFKPEVNTKGLQFIFRNGLPAKNSNIKSDNEKVYGILTNLIKNAIKFTDTGTIEFGYEKKEDFLEFFVRDTGRGISTKQLEYIFDRFRQGSEDLNRNYEGSGLGLTIAKSYVEILGGRIYVESQEGKGSTFYFTIPYIPVSEFNSETKNVSFPKHKGLKVDNLKILIVEDDEISHSLLTKAVENISKHILHAINGLEAVKICRNHPEINVVLMDIRMHNMNGLEATKKIREFNQNVIIIAQTAYGFESDSEKALESGCNDYISKPISLTLLMDIINKHLSKK